MRSTFARRLLHVAPIIGALVLLLADPRPAQAVMCFQNLEACYFHAAVTTSSYWTMWFMGLDCELGFIDCTRRAIIGR
jgi:hypothetical protein